MSTSDSITPHLDKKEDDQHHLPNSDSPSTASITTNRPSMRVVVFYYGWYGNPTHNEAWLHWNHKALVDGGSEYQPPDDIGANFYPMLGPYSSTDPEVIETHMQQIKQAGIGIICTSWWGNANADGQLAHQKGFTDKLMPTLLDAAHRHGLKIVLHHEPYEGRNALSIARDLQYLHETYGSHPALFRWKEYGDRPVYFVYDAYLTKSHEWASILAPSGAHTIRGKPYDAVMISLYVDSKDRQLITAGHFDGCYTYFASDGFTQGSTSANWKMIAKWAAENNKIFIPSVGPGYDDTRIRPWNSKNRKSRNNGAYYDRMWEAAIGVKESAAMVSITSFNEWHEGTQIEPAIPKSIPGYQYSDYLPLEPDYYLKRTKFWVDQFDQNPS